VPVAAAIVAFLDDLHQWRVELADPAAASLRAAIALRGELRSFGLSLLQG